MLFICYLYDFVLLMKPTITLSPLQHKDVLQIAIGFVFDAQTKTHVKGFAGVIWSQTHKTFYVPYSAVTLNALFHYFKDLGYYIDYSGFKKVPSTAPKPVKKRATKPSKEVLYQGLSLTNKDLLKQFINYLKGKRYSESTIQVYGYFILRFLAYQGERVFTDWTTRDIEQFMSDVVAKEDYSISSHRQCVSAFKLFTLFCGLSGFDATHFERPKKSKYLPVVLSAKEILTLIQVTKNLKHRAIISMLYSGGLRIGELLQLKPEDIDYERGMITVRMGKGRKDRSVVLSDAIRPLLSNYLTTYRPKGFMFEGQDGGAYTASSVRKFLKASCKLAGIRKAVTPHTLRHSYATHMLENGVDLRYIQELLGHSRPETTMIYTHVAEKDLVKIKNPLDVAVGRLTNMGNGEEKLLISRGEL